MAKRLRRMQKAKPDHGGARLITISRKLRAGLFGTGFAALAAASLSGCAAPAPRVASPGPEAVVSGRVDATVLLIRPVPATTPQGSGAVLAAMGAPAGQTAGEAEVILRTDQGAVLSIVQSDTRGLMPGSRVVVLTSPRLQLARPGYASPAS